MKQLILLLLCLPVICLAQANEGTQGAEELDQKDLEELEKNQKAYQKQMESMMEGMAIKDGEVDLKNLNSDEVMKKFKDKFVNEQAKKTLNMFAKDNPFSKLPREEVEENLLGGLPDNWLGRFIQKSPRLKKFIVDVFHSKEVIPGLVQIVLQEKKIKLCGYMAIFCLLSYWIGGYFLTRHKRYLTDRIKAKLPLFLGLTVLNLGTFYYFFSKEITPFLKVFSQNFLT
jgi:hypothetical protein